MALLSCSDSIDCFRFFSLPLADSSAASLLLVHLLLSSLLPPSPVATTPRPSPRGCSFYDLLLEQSADSWSSCASSKGFRPQEECRLENNVLRPSARPLNRTLFTLLLKFYFGPPIPQPPSPLAPRGQMHCSSFTYLRSTARLSTE